MRSFAPTLTEADTGEFSITVKFDDRQYKYFLSMNYKDGTVQVETSAPPKGREAGLRLPESIRGIFTPEFVRRFVFDGEQAAKSMDSSSNEADETIRYLYRLDELDEILAANQRILTEIQNAEGKRGTSSSLSNLRTRQSDIDAIRAKLRARCEKDLVERYPVQYRDCKAQIAGLLVASEARRLGIDTQSPKLEQIMLQYLSNNDTLLSEDGIKTLNAYALKGYRLITDYPLFDKPTSREEFLDAFNVAMQFYEKKDS